MEIFHCEQCGGDFKKGWTDEEARAEANKLWTKEEFDIAGEVVVCDDCFKEK